MIRLDDLSKSFGGRNLFRNLNWQMPENRSVGLVGPNGVGKSTLFKIIAGVEEADSGQVIIPRTVNIGYLPQELTGDDQGSLMDIVLKGRQDILEQEAQLQVLEAKLAEPGAGDNVALSQEYGNLQEAFRRNDGYTFRSRARELAAGVGFSNQDFDRPISDFSGGWQMRGLLCQLLLRRPDILLLDEPTNHLDVESLEWLESYLKSYEGTIIIISHDRYFLNRLVDEIAEMHRESLFIFQGNYDAYLKERDQRRQQLIEQAEAQRKEMERIERFVERFRYQANKASQVQSRVKQLEKIDVIEVPPEQNIKISFSFPQPPRMGKIVLRAQGLAKSYGDNTVFQDLDFELFRGDKVAIVGPNGAGKTTLLKMLSGALSPDAGRVECGHKVEMTYFAQHAVDQLDVSRTVIDEMDSSASYDAAPGIRSLLGAFLFRGDDITKRISVLSGGEKSRLALAKMLLEPGGCLLLDEPTNHLDIPSRQVLEHALRNFEGAFCVISHDRYFLNEVVTKVIHIEDGTLTEYTGDYDYYRWKRAQEHEGRADASDPAPGLDDGATTVSRKDQRRLAAELRKRRNVETQALRTEIKALEAEIERLEAQGAALEAQLADPQTYESGQDVGALNMKYHEVFASLEEAMNAWEEKGATLEAIDQRYAAEEAEIQDYNT